MRRFIRLLALVLLLGGPLDAAAEEIAVAPGAGAIAAAIDKAEPGDVLRLDAGTYPGAITVDRPLTILGGGQARIVGPGEGTVIMVTADDVTVRGVVVTGSGVRLDELDAGIAIAKGADRARILDNRVEGNLIGIDVQGGIDAIVSRNRIANRSDLRRNERGSGLYVWNAPGLLAEDNEISGGRDGIFVTTSHHAVYRGNRMSDLRFAFHSMYANDVEVAGNVSRDNEMGFAFMYSKKLAVRDNLSVGDRTHGIFLNFVNNSVFEHNAVREGGEKCLFVYNANSDRVSGNLFEGCGIGVHFTAGSQNVTVVGNAFVNNRTQVKHVGTRWLEWSEDGRGNYWSDHVAYDIDGDGLADAPYRPNDAIDLVTWRQPMAKLLLGSPAVQLIRWSQSRFPELLPGGVIDSRPLMRPEGIGVRPDNQRQAGQP
ncbi:nitrous oxide reductase family maturation protein NosD [Jiella marina]|uniref:nitrous oxide reductase family maturation protein NosD n=1 Tax=Jiella sp. LLJ827 TaxID=2917712 RepID=UPI0021011275|nr:nitrous oxide reductase family maturation protein NosD [Jiella sp. LLJ827]MCQ0990528.1 nitrous oxide reductase family maturation protein NosD [Jiella sp. LLJ827]